MLKKKHTKPKHIIIKLLKIRNKNTILNICRERASCIRGNNGNDNSRFFTTNKEEKSIEQNLQTTENKQQQNKQKLSTQNSIQGYFFFNEKD